MAEETSAATAVISRATEETLVAVEGSDPDQRSDAPEEEEANETPAAEVAPEMKETDSSAPDHKRKLEDMEKEEDKKESDLEAVEKPEDLDEKEASHGDEIGESKRQKVVGDVGGVAVDGAQEVQNVEATKVGNGQTPSIENAFSASVEISQKTEVVIQQGIIQQGTLPSAGQDASSRKIEVPNNKVGVLIGKSGDTIRNLQRNSGAQIQITRDAQVDTNATSRPVELIGTLEQINKAEQLIKDVIDEADARGSPALIAQGYGAGKFGSELYEMQVPNEKVGMIIGKGGETIKSLQTTSGARIQLIPQQLLEGDVSKERTVRVTGNRKQIDAAKEMIKEVMNKVPVRPSPLSAGYSQSYRPRGPTPGSQWGPRGGPPPVQNQPQQPTGYDYQQRGMYPPQSTQYPPQSYSGGYPQQPPRSSTGYEQRPGAPAQTPPTGGYNYYGQQGGHGMGTPASSQTPAAAVNYNYAHPQAAAAAGYGQTNAYPQTAPSQQSYGPGYNEPKYDNQAPIQQVYGQQPVSSQPGYAQPQPYSKPASYGGGGPPQSYGPPRPTQQGDPMYQAQIPPSYGSAPPTQQSYPYDSTAPPSQQPTPAYGQTYGPPSGNVDGYNQPPPSGYTQGYGQGGQPAYTQPGAQSGGYGQYASAQPGYGEQPPANNVNYGYQGGSGDASYGNAAPNSGYGATPIGSQPAGYTQTAANPAGYDQSATAHYGYGSQPGSVPAGYANGVSPQPGGYGGWTA